MITVRSVADAQEQLRNPEEGDISRGKKLPEDCNMLRRPSVQNSEDVIFTLQESNKSKPRLQSLNQVTVS
jgi:hypothetical protein